MSVKCFLRELSLERVHMCIVYGPSMVCVMMCNLRYSIRLFIRAMVLLIVTTLVE